MYKKEKLVLAVIAIIISGTVIITSFVFGIIQIAHSRYDDVYTFTIKLTGQKKDLACGNFIAAQNEHLSFWLKIPDRRIENKDFQLSVNITDNNKAIDTTWKNDFRFGSWRNGTEQGQYYHLGTYDFKSNFNGTVCYKTSGSWIAPYNGALVILRRARFKMPWRDLKFFSFGLLLFALGLKTFLKTKNSRIDLD
ncbi:MAG: hypothetical protein KKD05_01995 [Candidatus Omnitrophica bacterium]|nr:hypothetical protein [Candidatus Omnitrophota bacterium]